MTAPRDSESDWKDEAAAGGAEVDASLESPAESGVDAGEAARAEAEAYAASEAAYAQYVPAEEIDDEGGEDSEDDGRAEPVPHDLKSLRKLIDQKNKSMVRLLNRRAGYALKIAEIKHAQGLPVRDDAREAQVLEKVSKYNKGPLSDAALHRIFNCIMEEHRRLEEEAKALPGSAK